MTMIVLLYDFARVARCPIFIRPAASDERDIRFGSTDPGLFGSTFEATGKGMPKRGGAAATNDR